MFSVLSLAGAALAASNATTTVESTAYVTIPCPSNTTLTYGSTVYTVSEATTLTVEDCSCTDNHKVPTAAAVASSVAPVVSNTTASHSPALSNNAGAATVGAAAVVVGAVAYLL